MVEIVFFCDPFIRFASLTPILPMIQIPSIDTSTLAAFAYFCIFYILIFLFLSFEIEEPNTTTKYLYNFE
jgi:hypothetical protein